MPVERFTLEQFHMSLPKTKDGKSLFECIGLVTHPNGSKEYCFTYTRETVPMRILIQSSIDPSCYSADVGEDSIRIVLQCKCHGSWMPVGKGPDAYTTRVTNWQQRLKEKIKYVSEKMHRVKKQIPDGCVVRYVKSGNNAGRPFFVHVDGDKKVIGWLD